MPQDFPAERFKPDLATGSLPDSLRFVLRDYRALAGMRHSVKSALWLALMRPTEELFVRESFTETAREGETRSIPAVMAWAETIVRKSIRDMQAAGIIADRIEGKVGTRRDEEDPEDIRRRGDVR
jgi:hypothetical protein